VLDRSSSGVISQEVAVEAIRDAARQSGLNFKLIAVAEEGQRGHDVRMRVGGQEACVEVKGVRDEYSPTVLVEKSVRRDAVVPGIVNTVSELFIDHQRVGGGVIGRVMDELGYRRDFLGMIDFFRDHVDPRVGLSEDYNSTSSGRMPRELSSSAGPLVNSVRRLLIRKLQDDGNSYLAVHVKSTDEVYLYHTGYGPNPLGADAFPRVVRAAVDTYGGSSRGATRVALKTNLTLV
jgi:hypothetical protein